MPRLVPALTLVAALTAPLAAQELRIGVAAPLSGAREILGRQILDGARAGLGDGATLVEADTACSSAGGETAARALAEANVAVAVGFLCTPALESALPILTQSAIPAIVVGVRATRITDQRDRTDFSVWRLGPRSDAEADALADLVAERWRGEAFGIVEDGSAYARDLADEVRARLSARAIEPALVDNYRPAEDRQFAIARRILQSGVTRVLLLGTRRDVAIIARDAAEIDLDLTIAGGEALIDEPAADVELPEGVLAVGIPDPVVLSAEEPVREGYLPAAQAAAEIARAVIETAGGTNRPLGDVLSNATFQTNLGPIAFDEKGDSNWDAFETLVFDGSSFVAEPES